MVTSPYEWKFLEWNLKPQTNKQTNIQTKDQHDKTHVTKSKDVELKFSAVDIGLSRNY